MTRYWVQLPQAGRVATRNNVRAYAAVAEELGFTGAWVGDHIVIPEDYSSKYPYGTRHPVAADRPFLEAYTTLAYVAGHTEGLRLAVTVAIAPYRHPVAHAKVVATLDELSGGRLEVAIGSGWLREEFAALGVDFAARHSLTDESIDVMRHLWTGEAVTYRGRHVDLHGIRCLPRPAQRPHPPLWLGGSSRRAFDRIHRTGAGWLGPDLPVAEFLRMVSALRNGTRRDTSSVVPVSAKLWVLESDTDEPDSLALSTGRPQTLELLSRLIDAGVTDVRLDFSRLAPRDRLGALARLGRQLEEGGYRHA